MQPYPPLGTLYAASVLRSHGISVAFFDTMLREPEQFLETVKMSCPKIVVIYEDDFNFLTKMCLSRMREVAWQMAEIARSSGAKVIAHGSDASDHAEQYLQHGVDYVLFGEAETRLAELCSALLRGQTSAAFEGLAWSDPIGCVKRTPNPTEVTSWTSLPNPARDLIDMKAYRQAWKTAHGHFSLNLVASRGCPYQCNWCAKPISGGRFHVRTAESVAEEVSDLKEVYGAEHLWFGDDVFALNRHWAAQFADEIEKRDCALPYKIQSRADLMTEETVDALRRSGCSEIWMGVESGSQKVLNAMDKGLQVLEVIAARERLHGAGIRACYFLQFGYPGEQWEDIQQTIALIRETRPDDIGVSFSYPLPNTVFYERVRAELGEKRNWTDSDDLCVMFKGAYTDRFYRAVREALHAEVDSWTLKSAALETEDHVGKLWEQVRQLESVSRNKDATTFSSDKAPQAIANHTGFVPMRELFVSGGGADA